MNQPRAIHHGRHGSRRRKEKQYKGTCKGFSTASGHVANSEDETHLFPRHKCCIIVVVARSAADASSQVQAQQGLAIKLDQTNTLFQFANCRLETKRALPLYFVPVTQSQAASPNKRQGQQDMAHRQFDPFQYYASFCQFKTNSSFGCKF